MKQRYTAAIKSDCFEKQKVRNREQGNIFFSIKTHYHQDDYHQRWKVKTHRALKIEYTKKIKRYKRWKTKDETQRMIKVKYMKNIQKNHQRKTNTRKKDNTRLVGGKRKNPIPKKR